MQGSQQNYRGPVAWISFWPARLQFAVPNFVANVSLMAAPIETSAFDLGVRPILEIVLPDKAEEVMKFRPSAKLQARIEQLAEKSTEGQLTEKERAEYAGYVRANKFVAILRKEARKLSSSRS